MTTLILAYLSTIVVSVLHGRGGVPKGVLIAAHVLALAGALWLGKVWGYWLGLSIPISMLYWFLFRTGKQAKAEMDVMAGIGKSGKIWQAYLLPIAVASVLSAGCFIWLQEWTLAALSFVPFTFLWVPPTAAEVFNYGSHVWPRTDENIAYQGKQRMITEVIITVAPAGISIAILAYAVSRLIGG